MENSTKFIILLSAEMYKMTKTADPYMSLPCRNADCAVSDALIFQIEAVLYSFYVGNILGYDRIGAWIILTVISMQAALFKLLCKKLGIASYRSAVCEVVHCRKCGYLLRADIHRAVGEHEL